MSTQIALCQTEKWFLVNYLYIYLMLIFAMITALSTI